MAVKMTKGHKEVQGTQDQALKLNKSEPYIKSTGSKSIHLPVERAINDKLVLSQKTSNTFQAVWSRTSPPKINETWLS